MFPLVHLWMLVSSMDRLFDYKKWFLQPIPPNGAKLDIPMSFLLRDSFKYPSDKVAD